MHSTEDGFSLLQKTQTHFLWRKILIATASLPRCCPRLDLSCLSCSLVTIMKLELWVNSLIWIHPPFRFYLLLCHPLILLFFLFRLHVLLHKNRHNSRRLSSIRQSYIWTHVHTYTCMNAYINSHFWLLKSSIIHPVRGWDRKPALRRINPPANFTNWLNSFVHLANVRTTNTFQTLFFSLFTFPFFLMKSVINFFCDVFQNCLKHYYLNSKLSIESSFNTEFNVKNF